MIKFIYRHNKNYSRYNIIKQLVKDLQIKKDIYILMAFSKNQFIKNFSKRDRIINDFFISNYDTYVYDRKKIGKSNPRAWWKYLQDWINFKFSRYLISDTNQHFKYWEFLFGKFNGKHIVLPVLADKTIYYPALDNQKLGNPIKILFYGSFIPLHGIDVILNAFNILEKKNISFDAEIIGNGQTFKNMKKLYDSLDLKKVKMEGNLLEEKKLADKIRETDIVLGIFGNSKKAKSVIPNKVYQSTACKKCTVTMTSNTVYEFYNENDIVVCANNEDDLAKTLEHLIKNPDKIIKFAQDGNERFNEIYGKAKNDFREMLLEIDKRI